MVSEVSPIRGQEGTLWAAVSSSFPLAGLWEGTEQEQLLLSVLCGLSLLALVCDKSWMCVLVLINGAGPMVRGFSSYQDVGTVPALNTALCSD